MSAIPRWARVGAKVVCVDADWAIGEGPLVWRKTYTVTGIGRPEPGWVCVGKYADPDEPSVLLLEAENPTAPWVGFACSRFRPLITLEDDMAAHFSRLLDVPAPTERERA